MKTYFKTVTQIISTICAQLNQIKNFNQFKTILFIGILFIFNIQLKSQNCQCPTGSYIINGEVDITNTTIPIYHSGQNPAICITGKLKINRIQEFYGSQLFFSGGSSIEVVSGHRMISRVSHFNACENMMWKGIQANSNGTLWLINSFVNDAQYGVNAQLGSTILIVNSDFFQNSIGVYVPDGGVNIESIENNFFHNMRFGTLLPMFMVGQLFYNGGYPNSGVFLRNNSAIINNNNFKWMQNGIEARNGSTIIAEGNTFREIFDFTGFNKYELMRGVAIAFDQSVGISISNNDISDALIGIFGQSSELRDCNNNTIDSVDIGIYDYRAKGVANLAENQIIFKKEGIWVSGPLVGVAPQISSNTLTIDWNNPNSLQRDAIRLDLIRGNSPTNINSNHCFLDVACNGIYLKNCSVPQVIGNDINYTFPIPPWFIELMLNIGYVPANARGIYALSSSNGSFVDNYINASLLNNVFAGMWTAQSTNNTFCCNQVNYSTRCFSFDGSCLNSRFRNNTSAGQYLLGMNLAKGAFIGLQPDPRNGPLIPSGNRWTGTTALNGAQAANYNTISTDRLKSRMTASGCQSPLWPASINPPQSCSNNINQWFNSIATSSPNCGSDPFCTTSGPGLLVNGDPYISTSDEDMVQGGFNQALNGGTIQWDGLRELYNKLKVYPNLLGSNNSIDSFYSANQYSIFNKFYLVDQLLFSTSSVTNVQIQYLSNLDSICKSLMDDVTVLYQALIVETNQSVIANLENQIAVLNANIASNRTAYYTTIQAIDSSRLSLVPQAHNLLDAIIPSNLFESNEKIVWQVYVDFILANNSTLTSNQIQALHSVAIQCPLEGGIVVFVARSLLSGQYNYEYNETLCSSPSPIISNSESILTSSDFDILPIPAKDRIKILNFKKEQESASFELYTADKKLILVTTLEKGSDRDVNIEHIPTGFYFAVLKRNGNIIFSKKLIISK